MRHSFLVLTVKNQATVRIVEVMSEKRNIVFSYLRVCKVKIVPVTEHKMV